MLRKNKKKNNTKVILIIVILSSILLLGYFNGYFNEIFNVDTSDDNDVQISFSRDEYSHPSHNSTFLSTVRFTSSAKKEITLRADDSLGMNWDDFAQISDYDSSKHSFDNEVGVEYKDYNLNMTESQSLQLCNSKLPVFTKCKNEYTTSAKGPQECYCQANGNTVYEYVMSNWIIDSNSTFTISRGEYTYTTPIYNCTKTTEDGPRNTKITIIKCNNNIVIKGMSIYIEKIPLFEKMPSPTIKMKTRVGVKMILHAPGTYTYTEPYIAQDKIGCYGGDVYWYDSDNKINNFIKACPQSQQCVDGNCTLNTYECVKDVDLICYKNGLYNIDGCGRLGSLFKQCTEDEVCLSNTQICKEKENANIVVKVNTTEVNTTIISEIQDNINASDSKSSNTIYYIVGGIFVVLIGFILFFKFKK